MTTDPITPALILISAISATAYMVWYCYRPVSVPRALIKTLPVALLALIALIEGGPLLLIAGLALSAIGDYALAHEGNDSFLIGLGNFAAAHLAYILTFVIAADSAPHLLPVFVLVAFAAPTEAWLTPHTGELRWPVRIYVMLITMMGVMAWALPGALHLALWGAMLFIASDTLLAIQMFRMERTNRWDVSMALWALYYVGQVLICAAFIL